ncbi:putative amidoligase enzyme-domain-containing protein [Xylaria arbuscula]|nr:putative amidoligase enzyme-domain-containing protein [Xylaria arbuscula]
MSPATQQTLGIELEFIIFYTTPDQPVSAKDDARYGPVIEAPSSITDSEDWGESVENVAAQAIWVRQQVADVITSVGFKCKAGDTAKIEGETFDAWTVVPDGSVRLPDDMSRAYSPLKHVGVEVTSPAFMAGTAAFEEISAVVRAINTAFRTVVPPCCGFHVHVGRGLEALELQPVKRIASLLWLAENLLNTLHPSCRQGNSQCLSIRCSSDVRGGMAQGTATQFLDESKPDEPSWNWDGVEKDRQKPTYYWHTIQPGCWDMAPSRSLAEGYGMFMRELEDDRLTDLEKTKGVRKILSATDTGVMAELMSPNGVRGAYNFANLNKGTKIKWTVVERPTKPTIEFRQAAGSLDEEWIVVWAKICLALCGSTVVESSNDDFFQLLYDCGELSESPSRYNVFDLLHDIGLSGQDIETVQLRLASKRHEREPVLPFHRPDDCPNGILDEGIAVSWHRPFFIDDLDKSHNDDGWGQYSQEENDRDPSSEEWESESDQWPMTNHAVAPSVGDIDRWNEAARKARDPDTCAKEDDDSSQSSPPESSDQKEYDSDRSSVISERQYPETDYLPETQGPRGWSMRWLDDEGTNIPDEWNNYCYDEDPDQWYEHQQEEEERG